MEAGLEVGDQGKGFGHNLLETMMVTWIKVVAGRVESRQICVAFRKQNGQDKMIFFLDLRCSRSLSFGSAAFVPF